ncbi:MAG TPA: lipoprotein [Methylocystis sp.]|nr:lipoprotein [Methylocystis sp.]
MISRRALFALSFAAFALSGCGRKGPLELPADVQAERNARRAEEQAAAARAGRKLPEDEPSGKPKPQPGDIGRRPPADYPFFLDPLL